MITTNSLGLARAFVSKQFYVPMQGQGLPSLAAVVINLNVLKFSVVGILKGVDSFQKYACKHLRFSAFDKTL